VDNTDIADISEGAEQSAPSAQIGHIGRERDHPSVRQIAQIGHYGTNRNNHWNIGHKEHIVLAAIMVTYTWGRDVSSITVTVRDSEDEALTEATTMLERYDGRNALVAYRVTVDDCEDRNDPNACSIEAIAIRKSDITGTDYWEPTKAW
jgi:hypothetical protein